MSKKIIYGFDPILQINKWKAIYKGLYIWDIYLYSEAIDDFIFYFKIVSKKNSTIDDIHKKISNNHHDYYGLKTRKKLKSII